MWLIQNVSDLGETKMKNVIFCISAGSVLRMLQTVMTEATFAKGLKLYLDEKKESFASPEDLYRNLQAAFSLENPSSTLNIADFMTTWELQPGFPVVSVARINEVLTLTQERYHQNKTTDDTNSIWSIPISYVVGSTPEFNITTPDIWLNEKTLSVQNPNAPKPWTANDWILLNIQETGYYRVNYDMNLWKLLIDELNTGDYTKIHQVNRAQLIDDSFNLARSQRLQYSVPLDIFVYLKQEVDYIPWASTNRALNFLRPYLISSQFYKHFEILVARSIDKFYSSLGAETKDTDLFLDKFGRNIAINWACIMGHEQCLADTTSQMERVSNSELTIVPDLETAIYCNGLRGASHTTLMAMYNLALKPENNLRRVLMLSSLSCTRNAEFLRFYLDTSVDPTISFYNDADRLLVISSLIINGGLSGIDLVLNFLIKTKLSTLEQ